MSDNERKHCCMNGRAGIVVALVLAVGLLVYYCVRHELCASKSTVYAVADNGMGMRKGSPVLFHGFKIGRIKAVTLMDDGKVRAELAIRREHLNRIKADSVARPAGDRHDSIEIAGGDKPAIAEGGSIAYMVDAKAIAVNAPDPVLLELQRISAYLNSPAKAAPKVARASSGPSERRVNEAAAAVKRAAAHSDMVMMEAQPLLDTLNTEILPGAKATLGAVAHSVTRADQLMRQLDASIPAMLSNVTAAASEHNADEARHKRAEAIREHKKPLKQTTIEVDSYE